MDDVSDETLAMAEAAAVEAESLPGSTVYQEPSPADVEPDSIAHVVPQVVAVSTPGGVSEQAYDALEKRVEGTAGLIPPTQVLKWKELSEIVADSRTRAKLTQEALDPFLRTKIITFKGGPSDGQEQWRESMPSDGLICFFANSNGIPEQAVYKIVMKEIERTEDERKAGKAVEWEWIAEYQGKRRYVPLGTVNGIRKGS